MESTRISVRRELKKINRKELNNQKLGQSHIQSNT